MPIAAHACSHALPAPHSAATAEGADDRSFQVGSLARTFQTGK